MIKAKCVRKDRDKSGNIIGYELIDEKGQLGYFKSDALKRNILSGDIDVINLKLTTDNKLVDKKEDDLTDLVNKVKESEEAKNNILYKRYKNTLEDIGVDIVGAFYVPYEYRWYRDKSVIHSDGKTGGIELVLKQLLENPKQFIGNFGYCGTEGVVTRNTAGDFFVRLPILILHKDGMLKTIMFYEVEYSNEFRVWASEIPFNLEEKLCERELKKNSNARYPQPLYKNRESYSDRRGYKIATMTSKGKIAKIDLESYLTKGESKKLGKMLVDSDIHYWISEYTYNNIFKTAYNNACKYSEYQDLLDKFKVVTADASAALTVIIGIEMFIPGLFFACAGLFIALIPVGFILNKMDESSEKLYAKIDEIKGKMNGDNK